MITKKRLEELIEKGATVYSTRNCHCIKNNLVDFFDNMLTLTQIDFTITHINKDIIDWLSEKQLAYLFETKEEADFVLEFQNITRTETLNLPTWEELNRKVDTIPNMFWQIVKCSDFILFLQTDKTLNNSQIILRGSDDTYNWGLTKENYLEACKIAKKLFLGEE